jgi:hypothetical protein
MKHANAAIAPHKGGRRSRERQHQHHETEQQRRQLRRSDAVAERKPRAVNTGGESLHAEVRHRAEVRQCLHQRQRDTGHHGGPRERQGNAEEAGPGTEPERPPRFQHTASALQESGARQHVAIRIEHEHEHRDRAANGTYVWKPVAARTPAEGFAQRRLYRPDELQEIRVDVGHHVGRHRHGQDQRPFEEAAARKIQHRRQPGRGHADGSHAEADPDAQHDGVQHELAQHGVGEMRPRRTRAADEDIREHRQDRRCDQRGNQQCGGCQRGPVPADLPESARPSHEFHRESILVGLCEALQVAASGAKL